MNCGILFFEAETLYFRNELQPWATRTAVCFSVTNFSAAPVHSRRLEETNTAAAVLTVLKAARLSNDYLNTTCTQESPMEVCS